MSFTVTEACKLNDFLDWFVGKPRSGDLPRNITEAEAKAAIAYLAEQASKRLYAGHTADTVVKNWPAVMLMRGTDPKPKRQKKGKKVQP